MKKSELKQMIKEELLKEYVGSALEEEILSVLKSIRDPKKAAQKIVSSIEMAVGDANNSGLEMNPLFDELKKVLKGY